MVKARGGLKHSYGSEQLGLRPETLNWGTSYGSGRDSSVVQGSGSGSDGGDSCRKTQGMAATGAGNSSRASLEA